MKDRNGKQLRRNDVCIVHERECTNVDKLGMKSVKIGDIVVYRLDSCDNVSVLCHKRKNADLYIFPKCLEIIGDVR